MTHRRHTSLPDRYFERRFPAYFSGYCGQSVDRAAAAPGMENVLWMLGKGAPRQKQLGPRKPRGQAANELLSARVLVREMTALSLQTLLGIPAAQGFWIGRLE